MAAALVPFEMLPGDWVIHAGPIRMPVPVVHPAGTEVVSWLLTPWSTAAVHVLDVTPSHLVVYDPLSGGREIVDRSVYVGFQRATRTMVDVTWILADRVRRIKLGRKKGVTAAERAAYPIRVTPTSRGGSKDHERIDNHVDQASGGAPPI